MKPPVRSAAGVSGTKAPKFLYLVAVLLPVGAYFGSLEVAKRIKTLPVLKPAAAASVDLQRTSPPIVHPIVAPPKDRQTVAGAAGASGPREAAAATPEAASPATTAASVAPGVAPHAQASKESSSSPASSATQALLAAARSVLAVMPAASAPGGRPDTEEAIRLAAQGQAPILATPGSVAAGVMGQLPADVAVKRALSLMGTAPGGAFINGRYRRIGSEFFASGLPEAVVVESVDGAGVWVLWKGERVRLERKRGRSSL